MKRTKKFIDAEKFDPLKRFLDIRATDLPDKLI
jgi:hypothetical protein